MTGKKIIITISREHGSGGRGIAESVARELDIPYYDKKLIDLAAEKSGFSAEFIESREQRINNSFLFNIAVSGYYSGTVYNRDNLLPEDKLFLTQTGIIREIADKESCVIVGRCADYILKDRQDCLNIFVYSDTASKVKRAITQYNLSENNAEANLRKEDKARKNHYSHYTGRIWGEVGNYHLAVNSDYIGAEHVVDMIVNLARKR